MLQELPTSPLFYLVVMIYLWLDCIQQQQKKTKKKEQQQKWYKKENHPKNEPTAKQPNQHHFWEWVHQSHRENQSQLVIPNCPGKLLKITIIAYLI